MTIPLDRETVSILLAKAQEAKEKRAKDMPDDATAIACLFEAYQRLKELGWRNIIYCPKNGSLFKAIEPGSTGIHDCNYAGSWPNGSWCIFADGDMYPSHPILFKED